MEIELLWSDDETGRRAAALALGRIGGVDATDALGAALEDEDAVVRRFAEEAVLPLRRAAQTGLSIR